MEEVLCILFDAQVGYSTLIIGTDESGKHAEIISKMLKEMEYSSTHSNINNLSDNLDPFQNVPDVLSGPGSREMQLNIWRILLEKFSQFPNYWVEDTKLTSRKNINGLECLRLLNRNESVQQQIVSEDIPKKIYQLSHEFFKEYPNLVWNHRHSKYNYKFEVPDAFEKFEKQEARKWAANLMKLKNNLEKKLGKHAIKFTIEDMPSSPQYIMNIHTRLKESGIIGGTK